MRKSIFGLIGAALLVWPLAAQTAATPKPKRINRAIEMLEQGQPIYYTGPGAGDYEAGKKMALTKADYINYELEHGAFDMSKLREFMRGLVDGGPTKGGHRTPTVIVNTPITGMDEAYVRANSWVLQQIMATGVHGTSSDPRALDGCCPRDGRGRPVPVCREGGRLKRGIPRRRQPGLCVSDLGHLGRTNT